MDARSREMLIRKFRIAVSFAPDSATDRKKSIVGNRRPLPVTGKFAVCGGILMVSYRRCLSSHTGDPLRLGIKIAWKQTLLGL